MEKVDIEEERASLLSSRLLCAEAIYEPQAIASLAVFQCFQSSSVFSVQVSLAHLVSFFFFCVCILCVLGQMKGLWATTMKIFLFLESNKMCLTIKSVLHSCAAITPNSWCCLFS